MAPLTILNPNPNSISMSSSLTHIHTCSLLVHRRNAPLFLHSAASLQDPNLHLSCSFPQHNTDHYGGWSVIEPPLHKHNKNGLPGFLAAGIGSSVVVLVAATAFFSFSSKGLRFPFGDPLQSLHKMLTAKEREAAPIPDYDELNDIADSGELNVSESIREASGSTAGAVSYTSTSGKFGRVIIPAVDSTQQEALAVLKKLKIIEDDVKAGELCTRREYARWLVRINSLLERNLRLRIVPAISSPGSVVCAFDDVSVDDPDFYSIQALAEAGLVPSKLSQKKSTSNGSSDNGAIYFLPERFISRQDMINWKVQLEYEFLPGILEQISRTKVAFMDMKDISSDAAPELFMDMLAGDKSILRKVFGQIRRFQPNLPSTKEQAAVALVSGRMKGAINDEILRLESESSYRQSEMEEIKKELLKTGLIQRFWHEKLEEEKTRGVELEKVYLATRQELEEEKVVQEKIFDGHLKEKSAMDCQRQLLASLKEEVDEMSERLSCETTLYIAEKQSLQGLLRESETNLEELLDAKSVLGSKKEAIEILRSRVEDEAKKNQARAKVLEEVGRRWKWDDR